MTLRLLGIGAVALLASASHADLWEFTSNLLGSNEVPPNGSPATGTSVGTYDDATNMFMMDTNATGLTANVTAAHIHIGAAGVSGPIVFPLSGATGSTSYTAHDMFVFTAQQETDFLAGLYYVNIHTVEFPGGEIRGQLIPTPVPEPGTIAAFLIGGGLLLGRRRRN